KTPAAFTGAAWDFTASTGVWKIEGGENKSYPYLQNFTYDGIGASPAVNPVPGLEYPLYAGGEGTFEDPYQIADWLQLSNIRQNPSAFFILLNDLDEAGTGYELLASAQANANLGWEAIPNF